MSVKSEHDSGGDVCCTAAMSIFRACLEEGNFVAFDCWNWDGSTGHIKYVSTFHYELDSSLYLWMLESAARFFQIGEDMPGRIFHSGQHEECMDIAALSSEKEVFSRKQKAIQNNLCSYLGVPVLKYFGSKATVQYVLGFYGRDKPANTTEWTRRVNIVLRKIHLSPHMCDWMDYRLSLDAEKKTRNPGRKRKPQVKPKCGQNDESCRCRLCIVKRNNREYARRSQRRRAQAVAELPVLHEKLAKQNDELIELKKAFEEQRKMLIQAIETITQLTLARDCTVV